MPPDQQLPKSRLNQIAQRKLGSLGVATRLAPDGETLEGELVVAGPSIRNPLNGQQVERIRFVVEGHDHLRPVEPPALDGLPPMSFYDLPRIQPILQRIDELLQRRASAVHQHASRLRGLGVPCEVDANRGVAVGKLELTGMGTAIIEGDEAGLRAVRAIPLGGRGEAPLGDLKIELSEFQHRVDLELFLSHEAEKSLKAASTRPAARPTPAPPQPGSEAVPVSTQTQGPPSQASGLTLLRLAEKLGSDARVAAGVTLARDLVVGERRLRFIARHLQGTTFVGKLVGAEGAIAEEAFDIESFPGVAGWVGRFVGGAVGAPSAPATPPAGHQVPDAANLMGHLLPVPGEVWVMSVLVEADNGSEVRYVPVDIDGKPFGAPRVLVKADFHATFESAGAVGFRLPAQVLEVSGDQVVYVQLDPRRQPVGAKKAGSLATFVSHFVPEAAAY